MTSLDVWGRVAVIPLQEVRAGSSLPCSPGDHLRAGEGCRDPDDRRGREHGRLQDLDERPREAGVAVGLPVALSRVFLRWRLYGALLSPSRRWSRARRARRTASRRS